VSSEGRLEVVNGLVTRNVAGQGSFIVCEMFLEISCSFCVITYALYL
jgi:hypothetical protein